MKKEKHTMHHPSSAFRTGRALRAIAALAVALPLATVAQAQTITVAKTFVPNSIAQGQTTELRFSILNTRLAAVSNLDITNPPLPAGLSINSYATSAGCNTYSVSTAHLNFSNIGIPVGATCQITYEITANAAGSYVYNDAGNVFSASDPDVVIGAVANLTVTATGATAVQPVPTLSEWGGLLTGGLLAAVALWGAPALRRRKMAKKST
jgi:hypothetical protein